MSHCFSLGQLEYAVAVADTLNLHKAASPLRDAIVWLCVLCVLCG
jgi:hypothetical protein